MATKGAPPTEPIGIEIVGVGKDKGKDASKEKQDAPEDSRSWCSMGCFFDVMNHLRRPGVICMWAPLLGCLLILCAYDSVFVENKSWISIVMAVMLLVALVDSKSHYDLSGQVEALKAANKEYANQNEEHRKANEQQAAEVAKQAENNREQAEQIKKMEDQNAKMDEQLQKLQMFETEMNDICTATSRNMADVLAEMKTIYAQFYQMTQFNRAQMKNSEWHFLKSIYNKLEYAGDGEESFVASEYKKFRREVPRKYKNHPNFVKHFPPVKDFVEKVASMDDDGEDGDGDPNKATQDNIYNRMENMFEEFWTDYEKQELLDKNDFMAKTDDIIGAVKASQEARAKRRGEVKEVDYTKDNETRKGDDIVPASLAGMQQGWGFKKYATESQRGIEAAAAMGKRKKTETTL